MDVNARINWAPGMELTTNTFKGLDDNLHLRRLMVLKATSGGMAGVLPGSDFYAKGVFVRNTFEMERLRCTAVLPDGKIVCPDEAFVVPMQVLPQGRYYLCVGLGGGEVKFETEGVEYVRPEYVCSVMSLEEASSADVLPVIRFSVKDGYCTVDAEYMPPHLSIDGDERTAGFTDRFKESLSLITTHRNMPQGAGRNILLRCLYRLRGLRPDGTMRSLLDLTQEIVGGVDYYIVTPMTGKPAEIPDLNPLDVELWFSWVDALLSGAVATLDATELVDDSIDYDKLKAELREELHGQLVPELSEAVERRVRETLNAEIDGKIAAVLKDYLDGTFKNTLSGELKVELTESLKTSLYDSLYKALYDALYVPAPTEGNSFIPLI